MATAPALPDHARPVPADRAYRLLNHGPTVLVGAHHAGRTNAMAAAWACALDFLPPKLTVVLDKATCTRALIEASDPAGRGRFTVALPTVAQAALVTALGTLSANGTPDKMERLQREAGLRWQVAPGSDGLPLIEGCVAWMVCRVLPQPALQQAHDLFLAEIEQAWADERVFRDGRWHFEQADPALRTLHHVAGGHYYAIGEPVVSPDRVTRT
jgi:flavin reductase (DIM6/NTAB) family NADH-FMN oxidoreductase RutF